MKTLTLLAATALAQGCVATAVAAPQVLTAEPGSPLTATPGKVVPIADDQVLVAQNGHIARIDPQGRKVLWSRSVQALCGNCYEIAPPELSPQGTYGPLGFRPRSDEATFTMDGEVVGRACTNAATPPRGGCVEVEISVSGTQKMTLTRDGKALWSYTPPKGSYPVAETDEKQIVAADDSNTIYTTYNMPRAGGGYVHTTVAVDGATGVQKWARATPGQFVHGRLPSGVVIASYEGLAGLDRDGGKVWDMPLPGQTGKMEGFSREASRIIVGITDGTQPPARQPRVAAIDPANGRVVWRSPARAAVKVLGVQGAKVLAAVRYKGLHQLRVLDAATGRTIARWTSPTPVRGAAIDSQGRIVVSTEGLEGQMGTVLRLSERPRTKVRRERLRIVQRRPDATCGSPADIGRTSVLECTATGRDSTIVRVDMPRAARVRVVGVFAQPGRRKARGRWMRLPAGSSWLTLRSQGDRFSPRIRQVRLRWGKRPVRSVNLPALRRTK